MKRKSDNKLEGDVKSLKPSTADAGKVYTDMHMQMEALLAPEKERFYQAEMLRRAIEENVIVCLPTGSGKTFVAVNLIKNILTKAIQDRKKIVVLANKVHLVNQQGKYIQSRIGGENSVAIISGQLNTDVWKLTEWEKVKNNSHILVMTSEIFKQILNCSYIQFPEVALLIFDECHHATKGDPMSKIIDDYSKKFLDKNYPRNDLPKILGLTATVINGASKPERIPNDLANIENKFCSKVITHTNYAEVLRHSTSAIVEIRTYKKSLVTPCPPGEIVIESLRTTKDFIAGKKTKQIIQPGTIFHSSFESTSQLFNCGKSLMKILNSVLLDVIEAYQDLGPYCARLAAKANSAYVESIKDCPNWGKDESKYCDIIIEELKRFIEKIDRYFSGFSKTAQIRLFISEKLETLTNILKTWRSAGKHHDYEMCGIVFVKKRLTAQVLHWYFADAQTYIGEDFNLLLTDFVVGSAGSHWGLDYENMHFTAQRQTEALEKFRNNKTNLIFATSVIEEGLDVRNCNLGVRFDKVENYPSYVQSMGRVRYPNSPFYVLVDRTDEIEERNRLALFKDYNLKLAGWMISKSVDQDEEEMNFSPDGSESHGIPPFCPEGLSNSPTVTMDTAIQLVYRYCSTLPCDQLSPLCQYSWWSPIGSVFDQMFKAYLQLPSNSVVKEVIEGPIVKGKKIAKQAVHLEACKQLYYKDALDDHLLPITTEIPKAASEFIAALRAEIDEDAKKTNGKVGTKKRTQWYPKKTPDRLKRQTSVETFFMYRINFSVQERKSGGEISNILYNFERKQFSFGLIVAQELDMIPPFPLYGKFGGGNGTLMVSLEKTSKNLYLDAERICIIKSMQFLIFQKLLGFDDPLLCCSEDVSLLVTPLIMTESGSFEIYWDLLDKLKLIDLNDFCIAPNSFQNIKTGSDFDPKSYEDCVVISCCANQYEKIELVQLHFVIGISEFTSTSQFPFRPPPFSYEEYFKSSYKHFNIQIPNPHFPLLETKQIGKKFNFLSNQSEQDQQVSSKRKELSRNEHYPPDLVVIYPIQASILIQAMLIPSTIQRINRLLLSQEVLSSIASTFGWISNSTIENCSLGDNQNENGWTVTDLFDDVLDCGNGHSIVDETVIEKFSKLSPDPIIAPIELEYIHPDKITTALITKCKRNKVQAPVPKNPLDYCKNDYHLSDINALKFKSLDEVTPEFHLEKGPSVFSIMESLTVANAQDSISMERLEFIGDSVLKLCSTSHIYFHFVHINEGQMTNLRNQLVSNAHFYIRGNKKRLGEFIAGSIFIPGKTWLFPGAQLPENVANIARDHGINLDCFRINQLSGEFLKNMPPDTLAETVNKILEDHAEDLKKSPSPSHTTYTHTRLGDKNIADCVEALVGAYFIHGGISCAMKFMDWLDLQGPTETGQVVKLGNLPEIISKIPNSRELAFVNENFLRIDDLEETISYKFKNRLLLLEAFSYPDYRKNIFTDCYQRLEFLGDSILDFLIANHIYNKVKVKTPGNLTLLKSALVNNFTLASLTVKYGFQTYLLSYVRKSFQDAIDMFVDYQENNTKLITGVLPLKPSTLWKSPNIAESLPVPKVLSDIFESLIGAIYIDSGRSLDTTWKVIYRLMESEINAFCKKIPRNIVMDLYEKYPDPLPTFEVVQDESCTDETQRKLGPSSNCIGKAPIIIKLTIPNVGEYFASGLNKKEAKQGAAQWAMSKLHHRQS